MPPVFPTLLGMRVPPGTSIRRVAIGGWFSTLSKTTS